MNTESTHDRAVTADDSLLLDNQLCFSLYSTSLLMTKVYKPLLQALGLTYPQYLTMMVLWERDGMTVGEISTRLLTDPGSLTPLLKRLEAEGLLSRTRSKDDERVVIVELTAQGRALRDQAESVPLNIVKASCHSSAELRALQASLLSLRKNLKQGL
ncbi:MarR family transcriptional regulator [Pseudomonas coleopterorum]|uniref:MarR family winged helix-turn-helix transcriptional regulator n=1 Tax=Pseudomonas coleopterorum TaxID=1605838 RepID=UPI002A6A2B16|nr:MarR family transcriptional regulator [Pseudomonas coleopterorum]MDY1016736.1 MarR family transcriptional regulator [Pseudomonas coleopterorum]